jgi:hypothetical protein
MKRTLGVLVLALVSLTRAGAAQNPAPVLKWYRGNLHTHTINSDGDSTPYDVMAWYKRNGYQFLAITDHNTFTDPGPIDTNPNDDFLLIAAEEISNEKTVHVNALGITHAIPPQRGSTVTEILQASIDATRAQGGLPLINHPNFGWAFTAKEMLPLKRIALLEIASGHPAVNQDGDGLIPSTEQMWDQLLSVNMRVFAVAVDDVHNFREEFSLTLPNPGRGWVMVRAGSLTRETILAALENGDFYASTGVTLRDVHATSEMVSVDIDDKRPARTFSQGSPSPAAAQAYATNPTHFRSVFIGKNGRVLTISQENPARYAFKGDEGYVRVRVEDSNGRRAWTQPTLVTSRP